MIETYNDPVEAPLLSLYLLNRTLLKFELLYFLRPIRLLLLYRYILSL
jgi:hypothetical protein